jgi:hypothetical protein
MFAGRNDSPHSLHDRTIADLRRQEPDFSNPWCSGILRNSIQRTLAILTSCCLQGTCDECPDTRMEDVRKEGRRSANHYSNSIDRQALTVDGV